MNKDLGLKLGWCVLALLMTKKASADSLEFNTLYRSPYFLGRGDTGVACADGHEAIFYNPAGLAQGKSIYKETVLVSPSAQVSTQTKDLVKQAMVKKENDADALKNFAGKNLHLSLNNFTGIVFRRFALGGLVSADTNIMLSKATNENGLDTLHADATVNRVATISAAEAFWSDMLLMGTTLKYVSRNEALLDISAADAENIADQLDSDDVKVERRGYAADVGFMLRPPSWPMSLGLHIENLGTAKLKAAREGSGDRRLPQIVTLGLAVEKTTKTSALAFLFDFRDALGSVEQNVFKRVHLGSEIRFGRFIGLTGGLNQGYPTVGFFTNLYVVRLDVGLMTEEIGTSSGLRPDQRVMFRLMAGF